MERELSTFEPEKDSVTVLYIEDNEANVMLVEQMVSTCLECRFLSAENGVTGLEKISLEKPDLVLLDIGLPGMSGYEVLSAIHDNPSTREIPVVAISANAMIEDVNKGMDAGFQEYITKPIRFPDLAKVLKKYLGKAESE